MIEIQNVTYSYRVTDADGNKLLRPGLRGLNLQVQKGEFVVLTGGSGCGKTTVCRLINGLIPHYFEGELEGEVFINETSVSKEPIYDTALFVGSVFQNPRSQFFNVDTTSELAFPAENQGRDPKQILDDIKTAAEQMNLNGLLGRSMFKLSGGEKQRIACGSVSVADPEVIVLDEPTSNLDMDSIEELRQTLELWKAAGKTIIIAEHRLFFLRNLADRVLFFEEGNLIREFSAEEFSTLSASDSAALGLRAVSLDAVCAACAGTKPESELVFENVGFTYPDKMHGISIPSLTLPMQQIIAVIGHNGAGKSTLARTLCGLNKKAKGTVHIKGTAVPAAKMLEHCYMIMQDVNHQLFTESVLEEVLLSIDDSVSDDDRRKKADTALSLLDIEAFSDMHPMALSGGQKQRVAIAGGVAADKEIVILDEPTSGLDYRHMMQVADVLRMLKTEGRTVLVITHDFELISACADWILHLEEGVVLDSYPVTEETEKKLRDFFL